MATQSALGFYLDENVSPEIARQLRARGIDVVTARDQNRLGDSDINHLRHATELGYALCTHDADYLELAKSGNEPHAGIVFGQQDKHDIGVWVDWLTLMHGVYMPIEMHNRVEYIKD